MRDTRLFSTAFAATLASALGLGPDAAAELRSRPESYQAEPAGGQSLPVWLVRYKLRRQGYQDISRVSLAADGFTVLAHDRFGRRVRLFVDRSTGDVVPRRGYGLAHLRTDEVTRHVEALGYVEVAPVSGGDAHYRVTALDPSGARGLLNVDPLTGAVWRVEA